MYKLYKYEKWLKMSLDIKYKRYKNIVIAVNWHQENNVGLIEMQETLQTN